MSRPDHPGVLRDLAPVRLAVRCACQAGATVEVRAARPRELPMEARCPSCGRSIPLHDAHVSSEGGLTGCLACGLPELYRAKDFPKAVGWSIVVVAAVLAPFTYYASLGVAAVLDGVLYAIVPDSLICYVCKSVHHGFRGPPRHPRFDREIDERLRYGERAVMGKPMRPGGTAGAPEPEH